MFVTSTNPETQAKIAGEAEEAARRGVEVELHWHDPEVICPGFLDLPAACLYFEAKEVG